MKLSRLINLYWWMDPDGKITRVMESQHNPWAINYLKSIGKYQPRMISVDVEEYPRSVYDEMYQLGWIRVALVNLAADDRVVVINSNPNDNSSPNRKQLSVLKELALQYGATELRDDTKRTRHEIDEGVVLNEALKSVQAVDENVLKKIAEAAQKIYDAWAQNEEGYDEELGGGGICHLIAEELADILSNHGVECATVCSTYEQHVYLVCKFKEGVYMIDIPYHVYESGGGFTWKKRPDVKFDTSHVVIDGLDRNPRNFHKYVDDF